LASNMLQETFSILTTKGEELFLTIWKCFEFPSTWSRQQSPITHLNSYFFSDYLRLTMIMPFLINRAINVNLLKDNFVNYISISYNLRRNQVVDKLCYLWILFAKLVALVFKKTYSEAEIKNLNDLIIQWADLILKKDDLETFLNDDLFAELGRAYEEDLNNIEHLTSHKDEQVNVKLNVGDVVDVLEDITPLGNISQNATDMVTRVSYARIKAIILHQKGQLQVPFLFLDWFISQNTND
ncbi:12385_t:CDS:2, partial [Rhizophagus irregularis]